MSRFIKVILILMLVSPSTVSGKESSIDGTIMVEIKNGIITYNIRKRQVPSEALLDHFGRLVMVEGSESLVTIIFEEKVPLKAILNLRGIIQKAGLENIKQYAYDPYTRKMVEILFKGAAVPLPNE